MVIKNPKGGAVVTAIVTVVVAIVAGPLLLLLTPLMVGIGIAGSTIACVTGLICPDSNSGGGATQAYANDPCSSAANSCGMTNTGFIVNAGNGTGACNATPPPNSTCPAPSIDATSGFYARPSTVGPGEQTTLHWNASGSTACTISGDNGFAYSGDTSGAVPSGVIAQTTLFTLTCENGAGGPSASARIRVTFDPHYQEI